MVLPLFQPVDVAQATRRGHHVLFPSGRETAEARGMVVLPRSPRQAVVAALQSMGFAQERASSLASVARRSLLSLRRTLSINPDIQQPVWAAPDKARAILPALLAGSWDDAVEGDQKAIAALAGNAYEAVITDLVPYTNHSDPPVQQIGTAWSITSKEDAWHLLFRYLTSTWTCKSFGGTIGTKEALNETEREELEALVRKHSTPQQLAQRGRMILLAAEGMNNEQIARELGACADTVRTWRMRWIGWQKLTLEDFSIIERESRSASAWAAL